MENTKQNMSLDFTKPRLSRSGHQTPSLVTPICALSTPELNKMITANEDQPMAVLTPNAISSIIPQTNVLPSPLIPTTVNSNNIINNVSNNNNTNNTNGNGCNNNNSHDSTIQKRADKSRDLDYEKIEKKRERNRLAAKKCRQRKLETIDELRKKVSEWEQKYERLELEFERFKAQRNKEIEQLQCKIQI